MTTRRATSQVQAHGGRQVFGLRLAEQDGAARLLSQGRDGLICLWDVSRLGEAGVGPVSALDTGAIGFVRVSPCGDLVAAGASLSRGLDVWSLSSGRVTHKLEPVDDDDGGGGGGGGGSGSGGLGMAMACVLASSPVTGTTTVIAGYESGDVCIWDLRFAGAGPVHRVRLHTEPIMQLCASRDARRLFSGSADSVLTTSEVRWGGDDGSAAELVLVESRMCPSRGCSDIVLRGVDERIVLSAHWDGVVRLYGARRLKLLGVLEHHAVGVNALACVPGPCEVSDGRLFASADKSGRIALWDKLF